ncbi:ABC transporter substrate-binding protein [Nakamurella flavida]|uniref:ABC transporter substrate-binding protein n=1 Tax=Nakamurella flavida TaxID=363630 RepID=A0A938YFC5_9ACTN|nr:ABC transporter substrate-binding protein [Nakamurella flavida]MBM9476646.1 ABC transporter substrate-binding protein [Nakamurella flavida]MDP9778916.1 iron complex transport system substrate-binding protein [Nakamurella flavida]
MRRSTFLTGLTGAAVLLLTGCGTTEPAASGGSTTTAATASSASSAAGSGVASSSGNTAEAGGPVTLTDSRGKEITLDAPATRIAATEWNAAEYLVTLGVQPVGVADIAGYETWVSSAPLAEGTTDIGTRGEPSLDTLGTLDLDLVIVTDSLADGALEQIEAQVPVMVMAGGNATDPIGAMWENVDLVATATGTTDAAAELRTAFATTLTDGAAAITAAGLAGTPVAFSDAYDTGSAISIRPYTAGSLVGAVFGELGLGNAWQGVEGDPAYGLGATDVEGLTTLGDVPFWYMASDSTPDPYADGLAGNAIWQSLPFVTGGKVQRFPDAIWMFGGPASMTQMVQAAVTAAQAAPTAAPTSAAG